MKINSGEFKYRNIELPKDIRPTTEKVREAVFSMIGDKVVGAVVVDLFAGSGCLGLEALSRGAEKCWFIEANRQNFNIVKKNISNCRAEDRSVALNMDFRKGLTNIDSPVDIVIMDPPYYSGFYEQAFDILLENQMVASGGLIVAEHLYNNKLSDKYGDFEKIKEKKYGTIGVDIYKRV